MFIQNLISFLSFKKKASRKGCYRNSSWVHFLALGSAIQPVLFITDLQSYTRACACWQLLRGDGCGMLLMVTLELFLQTEPPACVHVFAHFRDTPLGPRHVPGSFRVTPKSFSFTIQATVANVNLHHG